LFGFRENFNFFSTDIEFDDDFDLDLNPIDKKNNNGKAPSTPSK
jgi:hypothetical protein